MLKILILVTLAGLLSLSARCDQENNYEEPPFPQLFESTQLADKHQLRISSEVVSEQRGYETRIDYVDLEVGKLTTIVTGKSGRKTIHLEGNTGVTYTYSPYTCEVTDQSHEEAHKSSDVWVTAVELQDDAGEKRLMQMSGLVALWLNAERLPKTYTRSKFVYSASREIHRTAHKWTIHDGPNNQFVHLYFMSNGDEARYFTLEMVQQESLESKKILQTTNILSIEYGIPEEVRDSLLQVPLGYGCQDERMRIAHEKSEKVDYKLAKTLAMPNHRIEMEVTATRYQTSTSNRPGELSESLSVELVRSQDQAPGRHNLLLMRTRDSNHDRKVIVDHIFNVKYVVDMREATCQLDYLDSHTKMAGEQVAAEFSNGLSLQLGHNKLAQIFDNVGFYPIKEIQPREARGSKLVYYERTSFNMFDNRTSRIIRVHSVSGEQNASKIESATVWVFDSQVQQIIETYHLNIIDISYPSSRAEMAKLFDMSEECYLADERMKFGRDYVWFELTYPTESRTSQMLASHTSQLKEELYYSFEEKGGITFLQMPQLEIVPEQAGFVVRALLLEVPSLHLIYNLHVNTTLVPVTGDASELAVDVEHCADLCRFHYCSTMTFCPGTNNCLLSSLLPVAANNTLSYSATCNTYTLPDYSGFSIQDINSMRLHSILSKLRHNDYTPVAMPKLPEELYLPQAETGVDKETYRKMSDEYKRQVNELILSRGARLPMLTLILIWNNHPMFLLPSRFEMEQDPLADFDLGAQSDGTQDDLWMATAFHQGLNMYRYKLAAFDAELRRNARLFNGLTYDQCALTCLDSKCSSFSYCSFRQECTITDIYDIGASMSKSVLEADSDCFVAQRDYASKFNKFENVYRPSVYLSSGPALNPSECAHTCFVERSFNCLAFDYCELGASSPMATCFFFDQRQVLTPRQQKLEDRDEKKAIDGNQTGCDHYARSYLADFRRAEFRQVEASELARLKTSQFPGANVDWCAHHCVNSAVDCTAFQFCADPERPWHTDCTTIESKPEPANKSDTRVLLDPKRDDAVTDAGRFFRASDNCHLFVMRRDAMEAAAREAAFSVGEAGEQGGNLSPGRPFGGLTLAGSFLLYLGMTLVFASLTAGVCVAKHQSSYVAAKVERVQILLGLY